MADFGAKQSNLIAPSNDWVAPIAVIRPSSIRWLKSTRNWPSRLAFCPLKSHFSAVDRGQCVRPWRSCRPAIGAGLPWSRSTPAPRA